MGKSSINGPFSMAMLNNQRVLIKDLKGEKDEQQRLQTVGPMTF
jgi:hypothetical protein